MGFILNIVTVLIGTALGVALGNRLPERVRETVLNGLGLATVGYAVLSIVDAMANQQNGAVKFLVILFSIVLGGIAGEALGLDAALARCGASTADSAARFVRGYVSASLLFCVGPMTFLGSIQDGLRGDMGLIGIKSALDLFAALAYSASLGIGVGFSVITIFIIQGGLTAGASAAQGLFTPTMVAVLSATGALLVLGIGLSLLEIKKIRLANFLPALLFAPLGVVALNLAGVAGF
jgi:uncharacterized protein